MNKKKFKLAIILAFTMVFTPAGMAATHLGQAKAQSHVTLVGGGASNICGGQSFNNQAFYRVFPDGTQDLLPFVVPEKQNLVVTDVTWSVHGGANSTQPFAATNSLYLVIYLNSKIVFSSPRVTLDSAAATSQRVGFSEHLTAGFVVGPGVSICPTATLDYGPSSGQEPIDRIILHGYLSK